MEIGRETVPVQSTDEYRAITRRVGIVLIAVGLLDIGVMIYCIANRQSYSSSLNIFAAVAGFFLVRGCLRAARVISWFSAFFFTVFSIALLAMLPWMYPLDYELLIVQRHPFATLLYLVLVIAVLALSLWIYRQLRLPAVLARHTEAGHPIGAPKSAFVAATTLVLFLALMVQFTVKGESGEHAKRLAQQKYGDEYKYFVTRINWSGSHTVAVLIAYSANGSKQVQVEWDR